MGAIYAELRVAGHVFPVLRCEFGVHQATDRRGRIIEKVRFEPVTLVLDVPRGDFLLAWAAAPAKRLPTAVVFFDAAGGPAVETLTFVTGAYGVHHREEFWAGDAQSGAYLLYLTLSDPDGFTMHAGGPASAFVAPAAREHGSPAALLGAAGATDWMAAQPTDPWQGKKQSGKAYLGSPPLSRQQLHQLRVATREQCGAEIVVLKEGDELLATMRSLQTRAAFQASTNTVFLQPQATYYEAAHEIKHAQQCAALGVEAYAKQSRLDKETYVYEQLMKEKHALTASETNDAMRYLNTLRVDAGLPLLTA